MCLNKQTIIAINPSTLNLTSLKLRVQTFRESCFLVSSCGRFVYRGDSAISSDCVIVFLHDLVNPVLPFIRGILTSSPLFINLGETQLVHDLLNELDTSEFSQPGTIYSLDFVSLLHFLTEILRQIVCKYHDFENFLYHPFQMILQTLVMNFFVDENYLPYSLDEAKKIIATEVGPIVPPLYVKCQVDTCSDIMWGRLDLTDFSIFTSSTCFLITGKNSSLQSTSPETEYVIEPLSNLSTKLRSILRTLSPKFDASPPPSYYDDLIGILTSLGILTTQPFRVYKLGIETFEYLIATVLLQLTKLPAYVDPNSVLMTTVPDTVHIYYRYFLGLPSYVIFDSHHHIITECERLIPILNVLRLHLIRVKI